VHADGERWIADAGYGEGWLDPLRVRAGAQIQEPFTWTLDAEADDAWWLGDHEWGSNDGFQILPGIVDFAAFDEPHERLSTSPESAFVRTLVVQQPRADRIVTLRARTFSVVGPGVKEKRVTEDVDDFARVLDEQFGIDPAALGDARLTHLWSRVCEQHEAWLAAREAA